MDGAAAEEQILEEWPLLWVAERHENEEPPEQWQVPGDLPRITVEEFLSVLPSFPGGTAPGWGSMHPKIFRKLPRGLVRRADDILNEWKRHPRCLEFWTAINIYLPKPRELRADQPHFDTGRHLDQRTAESGQQMKKINRPGMVLGKDSQTAAHTASYIHDFLVCYARAKT